MSEKGSASAQGSSGLLLAGVVTALLLGAGAFVFSRQVPQVDGTEVTSVVVPAAPQATTVPEPNAEPEPVVAPPESTGADQIEQIAVEAAEEAQIATPPSIDEVRVEAGGALVIAGRADPGARVDVLLDGEVVTSAEADASGSFAALGSVPAKDGARSLTLRTGEGAAAVASVEEIILAPVPAASEAPEQIAEAAASNATQTEPSDPDAADADREVAAVAEPAVNDQIAALDEPPASSEDSAPTGGAVSGATEIVAAPADPASDAPPTAVEETEALASENTRTATPDPDAVPESDRIAVLRSDAAGVTLVPTAPVPPASVVLDTISYGDDGIVQLGGRASAEAVEVRAYLDNRSVARLPVSDAGTWRGQVPGVAPGVYTLRIDALTAEGKIAARIETPFKREAPATLAAASNDADGVVRAITVQAGDTLWAIARDRYGEGLLYVQVFEANRGAIRDPDLIYPGQVFDLPGD